MSDDDWEEESQVIADGIVLILQFFEEHPDIAEQFQEWQRKLDERVYH
jgi:hypothetical protein